MVLIEIGLGLILIASVPYIIYLLGIFWGYKMTPIQRLMQFPYISIIISAYNESTVIKERIENIAASQYLKGYYEIILVDDCSSDDTGSIADKTLQSFSIPHTILTNKERLGTNRSYNRAISLAKHNIIVTTDADVFFRQDSLDLLVSRLISDDKIAAVCADLRPNEDPNRITGAESVYRKFYGTICDWESAHDSTYAFNGALVAFKKNLVQRIEDGHGADDANTAFESIRRGYRAVYEINSIVYETLPKDVTSQFRQKTRRAKRLIEATLYNLDLLASKRPFAYFYFLRIWMYCISPVSYLIGSVAFMVGLILWNVWTIIPIIAIIVLILKSKRNIISAFTVSQIYLFSGILHMGTNTKIWESTSKTSRAMICEPACIYWDRYDHGYGGLGWCIINDEPIISSTLCNECKQKKLNRGY